MDSIDKLIGRISGDNKVLIPNGENWGKVPNGFFLWLPAAAIVHHTTYGGQEHSHELGAGYHPVRMKMIHSDNATVVYAIW